MATTAIKKYTTHPATHPISPTKMDQPLTLWKAKIAMENHHFKWVNQRTFYGHFPPFSSSQTVTVSTRGYLMFQRLGSQAFCKAKSSCWSKTHPFSFGSCRLAWCGETNCHILEMRNFNWFFLMDITRPGKQTVCELENGPVEIVDLPTKNGDFPYSYVGLPERNFGRIPSYWFVSFFISTWKDWLCRCFFSLWIWLWEIKCSAWIPFLNPTKNRSTALQGIVVGKNVKSFKMFHQRRREFHPQNMGCLSNVRCVAPSLLFLLKKHMVEYLCRSQNT